MELDANGKGWRMSAHFKAVTWLTNVEKKPCFILNDFQSYAMQFKFHVLCDQLKWQRMLMEKKNVSLTCLTAAPIVWQHTKDKNWILVVFCTTTQTQYLIESQRRFGFNTKVRFSFVAVRYPWNLKGFAQRIFNQCLLLTTLCRRSLPKNRDFLLSTIFLIHSTNVNSAINCLALAHETH